MHLKKSFAHGMFMCALLMSGVANAASSVDDDAVIHKGFTVHDALEDTKLYFTAPIRWDRNDWLFAGLAAAAVAGSHEYDRNVRTHYAVGSRAVLNSSSKSNSNSLRDAAPSVAIIAGTWAYAGLIGDHEGYSETWSLIEAGVFSTLSGEVLKLATGRQRPDVTASPDRWRAGGDSFPSVHAAASFAIGTVFAESGNDDYRWVRRVIGYGVAAGTSYIRVHDNVHWLSDTVAGAALGIATARFILHRNATRGESDLQGYFNVGPTDGNGWMLSYNVPLR